MAKWSCYGTVRGTKYLGDVEASTKNAALEKANELDSCYISLCHQCSDECEDAEVTDVIVEPTD